MKSIEIGKRIKLSRTLIGKTLQQIAEAYGISTSSLSSWESGTTQISKRGLNTFLRILADEGLFCTEEWLLKGEGIAPHFYGENPFITSTQKEENTSEIEPQISLYKEIDFFKKTHKDAIIKIMGDESMLPLFKVGDYLGGIFIPQNLYEKANGEFCIIGLQNGEFLIRQFFYTDRKIILLAQNQQKSLPICLESKDIKVAPIIYSRRLFPYFSRESQPMLAS